MKFEPNAEIMQKGVFFKGLKMLMNKLSYDAVFFDFDGVILDSVHVKTKAFAKMFSQYGVDVESKVVEYHLNNGGVSRFDKFRYYYENFLGRSISEKEISNLSHEFSEIVVQDVIESGFISGAQETLQLLHEAKIPMYVVSGTPHNEIQLIVEQKGLSLFFKGVYGSPRKKWEILTEIFSDTAYHADQCLFIGDAMSDYNAAMKSGTQFLGIVPENEVSPFPASTNTSNSVELYL